MKYSDLYKKELTVDFLDTCEVPPHALLDACRKQMPCMYKRSEPQKLRFSRNWARIKHVCTTLEIRAQKARAIALKSNAGSKTKKTAKPRYTSNEVKEAMEKAYRVTFPEGEYASERDARASQEDGLQIEYPDFIHIR
jgi:hypothetical protein